MPDPEDLTLADPPKGKPAKVADKVPPPPADPAPKDPPASPPPPPSVEPTPVPRYRVLSHCVRWRPGEVVERSAFRPNAQFKTETEAEAATDDVIARLISLGNIAAE